MTNIRCNSDVRARKVDANLPEIVSALRKAGCTVDVTNDLWDVTIGYGGLSMLGEVKGPGRFRYTPRQVKWRETWTGGCRLIQSVEDALEAANTLRKWSEVLRRYAEQR